MTALLTYLAGPVVGAAIGYVTNDIAIRMLFKPHKPKYIFGWHVPFTPGIIPKEKKRIAGAVGKAIADNLMNRDVLERNLLSDDMMEKLRGAIDNFVETQSHNNETLEQFLLHYLSPADIDAIKVSVSDNVTHAVAQKLGEQAAGEAIAKMAVNHVLDKARQSLAGKLGGDRLLGLVTNPLEKLLAKHINEVLRNNAPDMVQTMVNDTATQLLAQPMSQLMNSHPEQVAQAREAITNAYRTVISEHLPRILQAIDICHIVEQRIDEMDMDEVERIILDVMKKELRAIVWLGALLGCIMGVVTTIINL